MKKLLIFLLIIVCFACDNDSNDFSPNLSGTGTGGSLAQFTILNNNLVVLNGSSVRNYGIEDDGQLTFINELPIGGELETIFPYNNNILIGSSNAVHFLGFDGDNLLTYLSEYSHLTACDPVVAKNGLAFSTLKISDCRSGTIDFLEAIDISDIENPQVLKVYETDSPFGLAIMDSFLFVCEKGGLSMYSYAGNGELTEVDFQEIPNVVPLDLIIANSHLIIRTDDGFLNLSYGDTGLGSVLGSITTD